MQRLLAISSQYDLDILCSENADLDGTFTAVCMDTGEELRINGWLFTFEEID